jgi:hypothetical protein
MGDRNKTRAIRPTIVIIEIIYKLVNNNRIVSPANIIEPSLAMTASNHNLPVGAFKTINKETRKSSVRATKWNLKYTNKEIFRVSHFQNDIQQNL